MTSAVSMPPSFGERNTGAPPRSSQNGVPIRSRVTARSAGETLASHARSGGAHVGEVRTGSCWYDPASVSSFSALDREVSADVVVIGAGITGLTAGYLLKRAGRRVVVIDRGRVGGVDTMATTAHVTCVTDVDLTALVQSFGRDHAQAAWDAGLAARDEIDSIVRDEAIDCEWAWVDGFKHAALDQDDTSALEEEAALAADLGFDARFLDAVPGIGRPGIALASQAKIHPGKYLARLAKLVDGDGSFVFEQTSSEEVTDEPLIVKAKSRHGTFDIRADYIVIATHTPLVGKTNMASATLLQTKLYLYTSYVVAGRLPKGSLPEALFWDTSDPYNYIRVDRLGDHDRVIFGGEDHKTGQEADTEARFRSLEQKARKLFPAIDLTHRWSGQVVETNDGLPFIGETSKKQFAATGFAGNGMTFGTLSAMLARDAVLGLKNPWGDLFDVGRTKVRGGAWDYLKENVDYPYYMIKDRFTGVDGQSLKELGRGQGMILSLEGQKVAASRDDAGRVTLLSPVCTHMGCIVRWNGAERTWDCPCHGSRFRANGEVLSGPADSPLERADIRVHA
jgi:glycine/D-amino acid oxidase-like deaminating enzyme/nitrite reductase/ring-hydroxylating ferredoxin subunit